MFKQLIILMFLVLLTPSFLYAQNNKYGIHLALPQDSDILQASNLVNSNGGQYGYVTLVMQENARDIGQWQNTFNLLRRQKLIPIIRLATQPEGENWRAPNERDADNWVNVLNSLNWVTKDRYIILFNEVNHAAEWGGDTNPKDYGHLAYIFAKKLKAKNPDFKIMLAGMDLAAPHAPTKYYDAYEYLKEATQIYCDNFKKDNLNCADYVDYISSHSYPNPAFARPPTDVGRRSVRGYEAEIGWFNEFFGREYKVFITETGWDANVVGEATAAYYMQAALQNIWLPDSRVMGVTPFVLNYQGAPFSKFSFLTLGEAKPNIKFTTMQQEPKAKGTPAIVDNAKIVTQIPTVFVEKSSFQFPVSILNIGQAIWPKDQYSFELVQTSVPSAEVSYALHTLPETEPQTHRHFNFKIKTGSNTVSRATFYLALKNGESTVAKTRDITVTIKPQPSLSIKVNSFFNKAPRFAGFVEVYDGYERLVFKQKVSVIDGVAQIKHIPNVIPNQKYRIVILAPYYLPRQNFAIFTSGQNTVGFQRLLPLDFNFDGQFSLADIWAFVAGHKKGKFGFMQRLGLFLP